MRAADAQHRHARRNSLGTVADESPKKSLICVDAISTAIPLVNPMVTDRGMNRTAVPRPVSPITIRITPAMAVHISKPGTPNSVNDAANDYHERAGRAQRFGSVSRPERRNDEPAMIAV